MADRKKKKPEEDAQVKGHVCLTCQLCGRIMQWDEWSRLDANEAMIYCQDCRAERESCGCSD